MRSLEKHVFLLFYVSEYLFKSFLFFQCFGTESKNNWKSLASLLVISLTFLFSPKKIIRSFETSEPLSGYGEMILGESYILTGNQQKGGRDPATSRFARSSTRFRFLYIEGCPFEESFRRCHGSVVDRI